MISFSFIEYLYISVAILINAIAIISMTLIMVIPDFISEKYNFFRVLGTLLLIIIVTAIINLLWRLICEKRILMFSIHEMLSKLVKDGGEKNA